MALAQLNPLDPNSQDYYARQAPTTPILTPTSAGWTNSYDPTSGVIKQLDPTKINQAASQESGSFNFAPPRGSGDFEKDFWNIYGNIAPSAKNLETYFHLYQDLYPGAQLKKNASGYADAIILPNGQIIDTQRNSGYDKSDAWQWLPAGGPGFQSSYSPQFSDPLTSQYEQLLQAQTGLYQQQQQQMQAEAQRQQATRAQTDVAVKQLMDFLQKRVGQLQQPAYSGSEAEVLRTRALEPIERDRAAANQRALENIGSRGFDPSSGIAQELLRQVNSNYDQSRSRAQNDLAYNQIQEERSRNQEAQSLLQYLAQLPEAAATGDLNFVNYLNQLVNQPGQNALATGRTLAQLPVDRTLLASQILGLGGQPQNSVNGLLSLLQNSQNNRFLNQQNSADFWRNLGYSFLF